jgi:hypothetical protein
MVPAKDVVLFAPASQENVVEKMKQHGEQSYAINQNKISTDMFLFTKEGKELLTYDKIRH